MTNHSANFSVYPFAAWKQRGTKRGQKRSDVRVIAATNRDLAGMVAEGTFREPLPHGEKFFIGGVFDEIEGRKQFFL